MKRKEVAMNHNDLMKSAVSRIIASKAVAKDTLSFERPDNPDYGAQIKLDGVPLSARGRTDHCDFCGVQIRKESGGKNYPAKSFIHRIAGTNKSLNTTGDWCACLICSQMVDSGQWDALIRYCSKCYVRESGNPSKLTKEEVTKYITKYFERFRENRISAPSKPPLPDIVHVHAQNVHDYFLEHSSEHGWDELKSFTCAKMPFPAMMISYDHTFTGPAGCHPRYDFDRAVYPITRRINVFVTERTPEYFSHYVKPENYSAEVMAADPRLSNDHQKQLIELVDAVQPDKFLKFRLMVDTEEIPGRWFVMTDETGQLLTRDRWGYIYINSPQELDIIVRSGLKISMLEEFCGKHGSIALATIQFMNCRNVEIIDNAPRAKHVRRAIERGERPPVAYKTLVIHPVGKRRAVTLQRDGQPLANLPLHIVRGHFKDFRRGPGLGRYHAKGIWWWPPLVRGSAERGRVEKDYEVEPK